MRRSKNKFEFSVWPAHKTMLDLEKMTISSTIVTASETLRNKNRNHIIFCRMLWLHQSRITKNVQTKLGNNRWSQKHIFTFDEHIDRWHSLINQYKWKFTKRKQDSSWQSFQISIYFLNFYEQTFTKLFQATSKATWKYQKHVFWSPRYCYKSKLYWVLLLYL